MSDNEIPGMDGLCWSDLPLSDEQVEDLKMSGLFDREPTWCMEDDCPISICGGPHFGVLTSLGIEVLRADQKPAGTPIESQTANEIADKERADAWLREKWPTLFRQVSFQEDDGPMTEVKFVPVKEEDDEW